jgi:hypothetical protein
VRREQFVNGLVDADIDVAVEGHALAVHLLDAAVDVVLFHLEVGNAEAHQPAGAALALVDMHVMADAAKLLGGRHAGRAGADDRHRLPVFCSAGCGFGHSPSHRPCRRSPARRS